MPVKRVKVKRSTPRDWRGPLQGKGHREHGQDCRGHAEPRLSVVGVRTQARQAIIGIRGGGSFIPAIAGGGGSLPTPTGCAGCTGVLARTSLRPTSA